MDKIVKIVRIKLEGRGCKGCILPAKRYFLGLPGVRGVHVKGYYVYLYLDPSVKPWEIIRISRVEDYYVIKEIEEDTVEYKDVDSVKNKYLI